jgi:hypothetical protein
LVSVVRKQDFGKGQCVLYLKTTKAAHGFVMDLDESMLETTLVNSSTWFNEKLNEHLIREYHSPSMIVDKKYGNLIKLHVISDDTTDAIEPSADRASEMVLALYGLRFNSKTFYTVWQMYRIDDAPAGEVVPAFVEDEDEAMSKENENEDELATVGPSEVDLEGIQDSIIDRMQVIEEHLNSQQEIILKHLAELYKVHGTVSGDLDDNSIDAMVAADTYLKNIEKKLYS